MMAKNIKCKEIDHLLYLTDDELDDRQSSLLNGHLPYCSSCDKKRVAFHEARQITLKLNSHSPACPDITFPINLPAQPGPTSTKNKILVLVRYTSSIAAAVLLLLFVSEQTVSVRKISMLEKRIQSTANHSPAGYIDRITLARNVLSEKQWADLASRLKIKPMEVNAQDLSQFKLILNKRIHYGSLAEPALFRIIQNSPLIKRNLITNKSLLK